MAFSLSGLCGVLSDFAICRDRPAAQYKGHRQPVRPAGEEQVKTRPTGDCALLEGNPEDVLKMHPSARAWTTANQNRGGCGRPTPKNGTYCLDPWQPLTTLLPGV
jgi:hypothetical protein